MIDLSFMTPDNVYMIIIACLWLEFIFEFYLSIRQNLVYHKSKEVPAELQDTIDTETFERARQYGIDKNKFSMFTDLYGIIVLTALLSYKGLYYGWLASGPMLDFLSFWPESWDVEIGRSICFSIIALGFNNVVSIPLSIYSTFVLEEKHGFNKQTFGFFVKDFIKKILVSIAIMSPFIGLLVKIVLYGGEYFFIYLWVFCFIILILLMTIYPTLIAPLFDKYEPLKDGPLKTRIEALAAKIKFPLTKLYVVEGSKRSAHSNAYLYGFFNNKRIVLFDTLIKGYKSASAEKAENAPKTEGEENVKNEENEEAKDADELKGCSDEEIEAVLGHELGHWKLSHVVKNIVISQINLLIIFAFFKFCYQSSIIYEAFGFPKVDEKPVLLGLIIVLQFLLQIYNTAMSYMMNCLSRRYEFEADNFAVELGYAADLKKSLVKLNKDNLSFPVVDPLYSTWHHSHPTLLQRIRAIDDATKKPK